MLLADDGPAVRLTPVVPQRPLQQLDLVRLQLAPYLLHEILPRHTGAAPGDDRGDRPGDSGLASPTASAAPRRSLRRRRKQGGSPCSAGLQHVHAEALLRLTLMTLSGALAAQRFFLRLKSCVAVLVGIRSLLMRVQS